MPLLDAPTKRVTGHLQVRGPAGRRKYYALWTDLDGIKRTRTLGLAHVRDSGRRTARGAVAWKAANGPCAPGALTPKQAKDALSAILEEARRALPRTPPAVTPPAEAIPTFGDAVDQWLSYLRVEKRRKPATVRDAAYVAEGHLLPRFGHDTPLYSVENHEVLVVREGRTVREVRATRRDRITTEDVDEFRRELLEGRLSPRSIQKILVLLHGVFKLAKRRKMIEANPSTDAERVTLEDPGTFNILEPVEFERLYRAALGELDERSDADCRPDAIDDLAHDRRPVIAVMLSTAFYAGLRMGELRDLTWRNVDFTRSMIRVESGIARGQRTSPKGKRARSIPLVSVLAERLAHLSDRERFTAGHDYVFANELGERVGEKALRAVFYDALARAGFADKRSDRDPHGNAQSPIRVHDLRHSFCTWAVNVWPITNVQSYAGHRDIKTTMRYVHHQTKADDARLAAAYLERVLDRA